MDSKNPDKENSNQDPFKNPDHTVESSFKSKDFSNQNPYYSKNLIKEVIPSKDDESITNDEPSKRNALKKEVSRSQFKGMLGKTKIPYMKISKNERVEIEKEMPWSRYGEKISERDVSRHIKDVKKEKRSLPSAGRLKADQKIKILKKIHPVK